MEHFLLKLRKSNKVSQEEMAKIMGVSRPTLVSIEKGERDLSLGELKKISHHFDIPFEILLDEDSSTSEKLESQNAGEKSFQRFHNLVLQCIKYGVDEDGKITKTKLAKLVYLCDFAHYYQFLTPISGFEYKKLAQGPVAIEFFDIIDSTESIALEKKDKAILISLIEQPDESSFQRREIQLIKKICQKWKASTTQEIVDFTHRQLPWAMCKNREKIPYELINMEAQENVY